MKNIEHKTTRVETYKRIELTKADLRHLICHANGLDKIPTGADIFVEIPGGADWSNTSLDISDENPVVITWIEVFESHE